MALINTIIPARSHELIRDQIGALLKVELANQITLGATDLTDNVFIERSFAPSPDELSMVIVSLDKGQFDNQNWVDSRGEYTFFVDSVYNAKSTDTVSGDKKASYLANKLAGVIMGILMHTEYVRLGFAAPFVMNRSVDSFESGEIDRTDSTNFKLVRILVTVKAGQAEGIGSGVPLTNAFTQVQLAETDQGFQYEFTSNP